MGGGNFSGGKFIKFSISMMVIIVINSLFSRNGTTVLFAGTEILFWASLKLLWKLLPMAAEWGLALVIIGIFCFYTYGIHPDKPLKLLSRWGNKSVLVIILTTRFP